MIIERVVKMSEKRFIWKCDDENCQIYDTKKKKAYFNVEAVDLLNILDEVVESLKRENSDLHMEIQRLVRSDIDE